MKKTLLINVNVLDGTKDMILKENQRILISDGLIEKIDTNIENEGYKIIDLKGAYVTPGLINMHVHLPGSGKIGKKKAADLQKLVKFMVSNPITRSIGISMCKSYAQMELYSGVTTLRTVGGLSNFDSTLAKRIDSGKVLGPRIIAADTAICTPYGHMEGTVSIAANSIEEAKSLVEQVANNGAKLIKIMITGGVLDCKEVGHPGVLKMQADYVKACCDKAHELGLKVAAHVEGPEGMIIAIENGVDTIEHGGPIDKSYLEEFKKRNGTLICTLSPAMPLAKIDYNLLGYTEEARINTEVLLKGMIEAVEKSLDAGVTVGLGTDTACPYVTHYDMWRELVYFTKYIKGVTPSFALHSATLVNATILGLNDITGSVEVGKYADLLVVKNNPLEDLTTLKDPVCVFSKGKQINKKNKKYTEIDERLDAIL